MYTSHKRTVNVLSWAAIAFQLVAVGIALAAIFAYASVPS